MDHYPQYIVKKLICPACGKENSIRFGFSEMMLEAPCTCCEELIRWKRRIPASGHGVSNAFSEYESEVAIPAQDVDEHEESCPPASVGASRGT